MDVDAVKHAAAGRWPEILADVAWIDSAILDGGHHPCPKCGGRDRFRLIDSDAGAVYCNRCLTTRNGDGLAAVQWMRGVGFGQAVRLVAEYLGLADEPERVAEATTATVGPEWLDRAYRELLDRRTLSAGHLDALRRRGLPDAEIDRRGYRTILADDRATARDVHDALGRDQFLAAPGYVLADDGRPQILGSGLAVPVRDHRGRITAVKVRRDGKDDGGKYYALSSRSRGGPSATVGVHVPLGALDGWREGGTLRITEGELKADVCAVLDPATPTVSIPGVNAWRPVLDLVRRLRPGTVRLALDADAATNAAVTAAGVEMVRELILC